MTATAAVPTDDASPAAFTPPTFDDVQAAARRLKDHAVRTPLVTNDALDAATGARVFVKAECLQRTGTFKFRGAYNLLAKLSPEARSRGVVAFSTGNHAQGVAEAARMFDVSATIVMPSDAPAIKRAGVLTRGGYVVPYDRVRDSREAIAAGLAEDYGAALAPSYDHPDIIAGQGTAGLEAIEDSRLKGVRFDTVLCCVGGGGLIAGIGLAFEGLAPETEIWGVEPEGFDDHRRSLLAGHRVANAKLSGSICDAILTPTPGALTWAINSKRLKGALAVTDAEALAAMTFAMKRLKLVLEPGGAVALAAALLGKLDLRGRTVLVIASGGNADPAMIRRGVAG
jgi:threonine dehydratase